MCILSSLILLDKWPSRECQVCEETKHIESETFVCLLVALGTLLQGKELQEQN